MLSWFSLSLSLAVLGGLEHVGYFRKIAVFCVGRSAIFRGFFAGRYL